MKKIIKSIEFIGKLAIISRNTKFKINVNNVVEVIKNKGIKLIKSIK